jgi:hypothetical protein
MAELQLRYGRTAAFELPCFDTFFAANLFFYYLASLLSGTLILTRAETLAGAAFELIF